MQWIRGLHNLHPEHRGCVLTIGNFDGVHLGHQSVIKRLQEQAQQAKLPSCVLLFEPHPQEFFHPDNAPPRLLSLSAKLSKLRDLHVDRVICLRFDETLSQWSAPQFSHFLATQLGAKSVIVGEDFHYGHQRQGDFNSLTQAGLQLGFSTHAAPTFCLHGERVSSSRIRHALSRGDFILAAQLLGEPYALSGKVMHGDKRGRLLGFPTANIALRHRLPLYGVYAVTVSRLAKQTLQGVANIGVRPTVEGYDPQLEIHLFDYSGDCYSKRLYVRFHHKIRDERKFPSITALQEQIAQDCIRARQLLG